eukprot:TRINITY_DN7766_c0_g1_i2.p1 TRINITY_DN7766_c0_g1~~TRINITY_DN7766_c0_g1_i2.p1  ORF type:complete len:241 (+),score=49.49 TRINITY_DN7766_c0_g1_i2:204-926(+)
MQRIFHWCIAISTAMRCAFFIITPPYANGDLSMTYEGYFFLNMFPAYLLYSAYTLLILFWAELYYNTVQRQDYLIQDVATPRHGSQIWKTQFRSSKMFVIVNAIVYTIAISLFVLMAIWPEYDSKFQVTQLVFGASMAFLNTIAFLYYGYHRWKMLASIPIRSDLQDRELRKVSSLTAMCTFAFLFRGVIALYSAVVSNLTVYWWLMVFFYICLEQIPVCTILFLLRVLPNPQPERFDEA